MAIFIEKKEVTDDDIGRKVVYTDTYIIRGETQKREEEGIISSFNDNTIWVKFKSPTGEKVDPNKLTWY